MTTGQICGQTDLSPSVPTKLAVGLELKDVLLNVRREKRRIRIHPVSGSSALCLLAEIRLTRTIWLFVIPVALDKRLLFATLTLHALYITNPNACQAKKRYLQYPLVLFVCEALEIGSGRAIHRLNIHKLHY